MISLCVSTRKASKFISDTKNFITAKVTRKAAYTKTMNIHSHEKTNIKREIDFFSVQHWNEKITICKTH